MNKWHTFVFGLCAAVLVSTLIELWEQHREDKIMAQLDEVLD
jgi:hypothetical protein